MSTAESCQRCAECSGSVIDAGEELVCSSCGMVTGKEVVDRPPRGPIQAVDFTGQSLGGYLGPTEAASGERRSEGISGGGSKYRYLKLVSDYAGREDSTFYSCAKTIERACEQLALPKVVMGEAVLMAKRVYGSDARVRASSAGISAFAIVSACKVIGVTSVGVREILGLHRRMGRRVTMSDLIQLSLDSPVRTPPRRAEDCLTKVMSNLDTNDRFLRSLVSKRLNRVAFLRSLRGGALEALEQLDGVSKSGHNPWSLAATSLYASEVKLAKLDGRRLCFSQREVAEAAGVAEYTVREQFRSLFKPSGLLAGTLARGQPLPSLSM